MSLNKAHIGKVYRDQQPWTVEASGVADYALATSTKNPVYLEKSTCAPPLYGIVVSRMVMQNALLDEGLGLDIGRMLHAEQDNWFAGLLRIGDVVTAQAEIVSIVDTRQGEFMDLQVSCSKADNTVIYKGSSGLLIRPEGKRGEGRAKARLESDLPHRVPRDATADFESTVRIQQDQSLRYAEASGDHNPIHKDEAFAVKVGLPGRILHGMCSMAIAQNALVDALASGQPDKLLRLRGRFSRPVLMGDSLTVRGYVLERLPEQMLVAYDVVNQAGKAIIKEGAARVSI